MGGAGSPALWPCTAPDGPGTSGCSVAHGLRVGQEAVLREHADPARRVALDDEAFVVDARLSRLTPPWKVPSSQRLSSPATRWTLGITTTAGSPEDEIAVTWCA